MATAFDHPLNEDQAKRQRKTVTSDRKMKQETYEMLKALRQSMGPECYQKLECNSLKADEIYQMLGGFRFSIDKWRILRKRIDKIMKSKS